jgi:hypothetical protein
MRPVGPHCCATVLVGVIMKRWQAVVLSVFLGAGVCLGAEPVVLTTANYLPEVRGLLTNAQDSIDIQMYFIIINPRQADDPVTTLVNDLVAARQRGVRVRVVLEDSKLKLNRRAIDILRKHGAVVQVDTGGALMHSKLLVVDGRSCVVGSTNWSRAALERNHEVGVLIHSEPLAAALLATFDRIRLQEHIPGLTISLPGTAIPHSLLQAGGGLPRLVSDRAEHAFDLYLYLLREAAAADSLVLPFDTPALETALECRNVRRPRLRLVERYQALTYDQASKQVTLLPLDEAGGTFVLPHRYWDEGLWQRLSLRGQFMYLVALSEAARSSRAPYWFRSQSDMAARYGLSEPTISLGLQELERLELIEVERGEIEAPGKHALRKANIYRLNPLLSEAERELRLAALSTRFGKDTVAQAGALAAELGEPDDLDDIGTFAELIVRYGHREVQQANRQTRKMKQGSSRRTIQTTRQLLELAH